MFEILQFPGFILGTLAVAAGAWWLGLRNPFVLTVLSLILGGGVGTLVEIFVGKRLGRRRRRDV